MMLAMFLWWGASGVIISFGSIFIMIPLHFGAGLIDWQFGTNLDSLVDDFFDFLLYAYGIIDLMCFFGVLGGIYELFNPKSSTRTATL